ncbi:P-type conjugative transfer protein TrbJ [Geobacter metallireducens RCH3]|uniref:Conjugal transfer entry/exclusion protein TrbJ n=1 Tax=Geobacter metallireducens (strain ATCC 53774 / DSM 7210 / GS-15) TaxID=269799 RepID=Q39PP7_GEOMG|nr:P-type conjugative transfer protein TrbJ [Geobacter metallireducens]ABB33777.1 conjugal transfer entry/exclusion protein TrbJ [Geobacter metallireducens GS-15]EHP83956.1 P-type conjugative transfer protein TrbJ [Geobacter metallireducens RCH3]
MKKALIVTVLILSMSAQAHATIPVLDYTNWAQNLFSYVQQVATAINTAEQLATQYQQLEVAIRQARQLNSDQIRGRIMNGIRQLAEIQQKTRGITYDYGRTEGAFDQYYPDMAAYNGMSGKDYAAQAAKANQQLQNSVRDAMLAQGLISNAATDQDALNALVAASNSADGQLAAAQAGNQISAMVAQQLIQLQQIMATSAREQSSYMAAQAAEKAKPLKKGDLPKGDDRNMLDYLRKKK